MGRFRNLTTDVVVSVDDSKDHRFANDLYEPADKPAPKAPAKKASSSKPSTTEK